MKLTREELIDAIRKAESLQELRRKVGPSEQESEAARFRLRAIDDICAKMDKEAINIDQLPWQTKMKYDRLMAEQKVYESMYC